MYVWPHNKPFLVGIIAGMVIFTMSTNTSLLVSALPVPISLPTVTPQVALNGLDVVQTNDLAGITGYYDVIFKTSQFGTISSVQIDFPVGTDISDGKLIEVSGISSEGMTTVMGQTINYEVAKATPVKAGQEIRLEFADIINPMDGNYQVTVTTRDKSGMIIDGPTLSSIYSIIQTPTPPIVIPISFAYERTLVDGQNGWTPDGDPNNRIFIISDPLISPVTSRVLVNLEVPTDSDLPVTCGVSDFFSGGIEISCSAAPPDGTELKYAVFNPSTP